MNTMSVNQRADVLIALSIIFDRQFSSNNADRSVSEMVDDSLRSLRSPIREKLDERAAQVESLSEPQRQRWLGRWIDTVRQRGETTELDQNINAEQIAIVLQKEPFPIRRSILSYLPLDTSRHVRALLEPDKSANSANDEFSNDLSEEIVEIVKLRFLENFAQIRSVCDVNALDEMTIGDLEKFIHKLGLREIAVACRGIRSREKIAAFLCRFAEDDAKSIATYLSKLDEVEPVWVSIADRTVQRLWNPRLRPHQILYKIGMELLACAFAERSDTAIRYTSQKFSSRDSRRWNRLVLAFRERLDDPDMRTVEIEKKRAEMIVHLAGEFKRGNL